MDTLYQPADIAPQPLCRPPLPPANWPVIDAWLAAHGLPPWAG